MAKVLTTFRIDQNNLDTLEKIAKTKKRTRSDLIRIIVEDYVEKFNYYSEP